MSKSRIFEGVFAIDKPASITSAQVVRDLQKAFNPSQLFAPWLSAERARLQHEAANQRRRHKKRRLENVKIGHGGTLDPMATGVLIIGVGKGTKSLGDFLNCTKSYEATVLLGGATDTYDVTGKLIAKAPASQITREAVEKALEGFRGERKQRPPLWSALRMDGKRLYEYAREGKEIPREIEERQVTVHELEVVKWLEPGEHEYRLPTEEADSEEKKIAGKVFDIVDERGADNTSQEPSAGDKRKRETATNGNGEAEVEPSAKRREGSDSGKVISESATIEDSTQPEIEGDDAGVSKDMENQESSNTKVEGESEEPANLPAVVLRMTVTSGFYVRSLCHDLGKALGSLGCLATLVRSRQGDFDLGKNTLAYDDLDKGEDEWGPKVAKLLEDWQEQRSASSNKED